jgi:hypothetical protein
MPSLIHLPTAPDFLNLKPSARLRPSDLVQMISVADGWISYGRQDLYSWIRSLALALSNRCGLAGLQQICCLAEHPSVDYAAQRLRESVVLGINGRRLPLQQYWRVRCAVAALPQVWDGWDGRPLGVAPTGVSAAWGADLPEVERMVLSHSADALAVLRRMDRCLLLAWGAPAAYLARTCTVADLVREQGLELQEFPD